MWQQHLSLPRSLFLAFSLFFGKPLWFDAALVNKLVPCTWLLSGALEILRLRLRCGRACNVISLISYGLNVISNRLDSLQTKSNVALLLTILYAIIVCSVGCCVILKYSPDFIRWPLTNAAGHSVQCMSLRYEAQSLVPTVADCQQVEMKRCYQWTRLLRTRGSG